MKRFPTHHPETDLMRSLEKLALLLLSTTLLAACGGNIRDVTGEPPQSAVSGIERRGGDLLIEVALRNVNDQPLQIESTTLELKLDGITLAAGQRATPVMISARGREVLGLSLRGEPAGLDKLALLENGSEPRLPWTMQIDLRVAGGSDRRTRTEGWLHPVPGQANRFR